MRGAVVQGALVFDLYIDQLFSNSTDLRNRFGWHLQHLIILPRLLQSMTLDRSFHDQPMHLL